LRFVDFVGFVGLDIPKTIKKRVIMEDREDGRVNLLVGFHSISVFIARSRTVAPRFVLGICDPPKRTTYVCEREKVSPRSPMVERVGVPTTTTACLLILTLLVELTSSVISSVAAATTPVRCIAVRVKVPVLTACSRALRRLASVNPLTSPLRTCSMSPPIRSVILSAIRPSRTRG
jgi:hypothetical protein